MAKLSESMLSQLELLGIESTNEDEVRKILIEELNAEKMGNVEEDSTADLIEMVVSIRDVISMDKKPAKKSVSELPAQAAFKAPAVKEATAKVKPVKEVAVKVVKVQKETKIKPVKEGKMPLKQKVDFSNPAHRALFDAVSKKYDATFNVAYKFLAEGIAARLENASEADRVIFTYNHLKVVNGELRGGHIALNMLRTMSQADFLTKYPDTMEEDRIAYLGKMPVVNDVTIPELLLLLEIYLDPMLGNIKKLNAKLNVNRKKMEESVKGVPSFEEEEA